MNVSGILLDVLIPQDDGLDKSLASAKAYNAHQTDELDESDLYKLYKVSQSDHFNSKQRIAFSILRFGL